MRARIPNSQFLIPNCLLLLLVCLPVLLASVSAQSAPSPLPDSPGKEVFESVCSLCHTPDTAVGKHWTRTQWEAKVTGCFRRSLTSPARSAGDRRIPLPGTSRAARSASAAQRQGSPPPTATCRSRGRRDHPPSRGNGAFKTVDDLSRSRLDIAKIEAEGPSGVLTSAHGGTTSG
jgi:hypothetical protein